MNEPLKQLNEAAEKYAIGCDEDDSMNTFIAGALSPEAANGCNKHVERAKIEFAIEQLHSLGQIHNESVLSQRIRNKISELQTKRKEYEN